MKKILLLGLGVMALSACNSNDQNSFSTNFTFGERIEASGPMQSETHEVSFNSIRVSSAIDAEIIKSKGQKVVISAPESIIDKVLVETSSGGLRIGFKPGISISGSHRVSAKIYTDKLSSVTASSSADIVILDKFTQETLSLAASSSGSIQGDVEANELSLEASSSGDINARVWARSLLAKASSSGDIKLEGRTKEAELRASSSGDIQGPGLEVESAIVGASSSGEVHVAVSRKLTASASSGGDVVVARKGHLEISQNASSGGSISLN